MSLDSRRSPEPFTSRAGRTLEAEADLSGVVREAIAPLEQETRPTVNPVTLPSLSVAVQEYLDQCRSCVEGCQFSGRCRIWSETV